MFNYDKRINKQQVADDNVITRIKLLKIDQLNDGQLGMWGPEGNKEERKEEKEDAETVKVK